MVFRFVTENTVLNFPCFETDVPRNLDTGVVQSGILPEQGGWVSKPRKVKHSDVSVRTALLRELFTLKDDAITVIYRIYNKLSKQISKQHSAMNAPTHRPPPRQSLCRYCRMMNDHQSRGLLFHHFQISS